MSPMSDLPAPRSDDGGVSLLDYMRALLAAADLRYQQRYDAQAAAITTALTAAENAVQAALAAAEGAVNKAEVAAEKRFDEQKSFVATYRVEMGALGPRLEQMLERLHALDRLTDAKFITFRTLIDSQAEKVALALASADKAVSKAEVATERRFESVNEFRGTLQDQAAGFVSRVEYNVLRDNTAERLADMQTRLDRAEGKGAGLDASWLYLLGGLGAIGTLVGIMVAFFVR